MLYILTNDKNQFEQTIIVFQEVFYNLKSKKYNNVLLTLDRD